MADHVRAMLAFKRAGAVAFDYGNNIRAQADKGGVADAFEIPGFVPEYIRPLVLRGHAAVSMGRLVGRSGRHRRHRRARARDVRRQSVAGALDPDWPRSASPFRVCPRESSGSDTASARGSGSRSTISSAAVPSAAPIVIGRDHLDAGSVASPYRETEQHARRQRCDR